MVWVKDPPETVGLSTTRCTGITVRETRCLKKAGSNSRYCHIHRHIELKEQLRCQDVMLSAVEVLETELSRLSVTIELLEEENISLQSQLKQKTKPESKKSYVAPKCNKQEEINLLTRRLAEANATIVKLRPDYDRYQIIKSYESLNRQLEEQQIRFNHRGELYHDLRLTRNQVAHPNA